MFRVGFYPLPQLPCKVMAVLLHFFFLSAFAWMLVEGLHLYSMVVKVFGSEGSKHFYYYGIGWGRSTQQSLITALRQRTQTIRHVPVEQRYLLPSYVILSLVCSACIMSAFCIVPNFAQCPCVHLTFTVNTVDIFDSLTVKKCKLIWSC